MWPKFVLVCSMGHLLTPLNTVKLFSRFVKQHFVSFVSKCYFVQKAFKYLRYKKVFLMKIPKQGFQAYKKNSKKPQIHKKGPPRKNSWMILYKNCWSYSFHEDVVIHQRTSMFSKVYWVWNGFVVVWYTSMYQCIYLHRSWKSVYPVCMIFLYDMISTVYIYP